MASVSSKPGRWGRRPGRALIRGLVGLAAALALGFGLKALGGRLERRVAPAGFGQGVVQGALMPCALPTLALGSDVTIYAVRNTGVPYKLGYTLGTTACGAVFFGVLFRRLTRWSGRAAAGGERAGGGT